MKSRNSENIQIIDHQNDNYVENTPVNYICPPVFYEINHQQNSNLQNENSRNNNHYHNHDSNKPDNTNSKEV